VPEGRQGRDREGRDRERERERGLGTRPMPTTGRRGARESMSRPQSMAGGSLDNSPAASTYTTPRTNRLQKKSNRMSAAQAPQQSSPLAPISPNGYPSHDSPGYSSRSLPRASTFNGVGEFENGGYGKSQYDDYGRASQGPPPPAKVPLGRSGEDNAWALLEEMKSIDLGSGRARRRERIV
jgi:hypothetical protein